MLQGKLLLACLGTGHRYPLVIWCSACRFPSLPKAEKNAVVTWRFFKSLKSWFMKPVKIVIQMEENIQIFMTGSKIKILFLKLTVLKCFLGIHDEEVESFLREPKASFWGTQASQFSCCKLLVFILKCFNVCLGSKSQRLQWLMWEGKPNFCCQLFQLLCRFWWFK